MANKPDWLDDTLEIRNAVAKKFLAAVDACVMGEGPGLPAIPKCSEQARQIIWGLCWRYLDRASDRRSDKVVHKLRSEVGTKTIEVQKSHRLRNFENAFIRCHVGRVSRSEAIRRAGKACDLAERTAWRYARQLKIVTAKK